MNNDRKKTFIKIQLETTIPEGTKTHMSTDPEKILSYILSQGFGKEIQSFIKKKLNARLAELNENVTLKKKYPKTKFKILGTYIRYNGGMIGSGTLTDEEVMERIF